MTLDGQRVAGVTPLDLTLDAGRAHVVAISLESYAAQELKVEASAAQGEIRVRLEPAGPLASVTVVSSYPIDVSWRGRSLGKGEISPRVQLPGGRQVLSVDSAGHFVRAEVADVLGRRVATLLDGQHRARGEHELTWDGRDKFGRRAPAGIYHVRVSVDRDVAVRKIVLVD